MTPVTNGVRKASERGMTGSNKYIFAPCLQCGQPRWTQLLKNKPRNDRCKKCAGIGNKGEQSPFWKGGRYKDKAGYIYVRLNRDDFFYPMVNNMGYVFEHRLVSAKDLGRCLHSWEIVHHENGTKDDNRIENLQLVTDDRHKQITILENRIQLLEKRVTLLEAENTLLRATGGVICRQ